MPVRETSVFINNPYDDEYKPFFEALVFTVAHCGFTPRSALEVVDSGLPRLERIVRILKGSAFSIHDVSRVKLDPRSKLPRFNMPLELGMAIGMKMLGDDMYRDHRILVVDGAPSNYKFRYQRLMSDLAGVDIKTYAQDTGQLIGSIRSFLASHGSGSVAGPSHIAYGLQTFQTHLPTFATAANQQVAELEYPDILRHMRKFLAGGR